MFGVWYGKDQITMKLNVVESPLDVQSNQHYTHSKSYMCVSLIVP